MLELWDSTVTCVGIGEESFPLETYLPDALTLTTVPLGKPCCAVGSFLPDCALIVLPKRGKHEVNGFSWSLA